MILRYDLSNISCNCTRCLRWQHRTCRTQITFNEYRSAQRNKQTIQWKCEQCSSLDDIFPDPMLNSTTVYYDGRSPEHMDISESSIDSVSETTIPTTALSTFTIAHNALRIAENASTPEVSGNTTYPIDDPTSFANRPCIDIDHMTQQDMDTIVIPEPIEESSLESIAPMDIASSDELEEFQVIEGSSQRGKKKLVDSKGYTYTVKRESAKSVLWRCSVRSKGNVCGYTIGFNHTTLVYTVNGAHSHPPPTGAATELRVRRDIRTKAIADVFRPACVIVNEVMTDLVRSSQAWGFKAGKPRKNGKPSS